MNEWSRTCIFCPRFDWHGTRLSNPNAVFGQHSKLVLDPGVKVHDSGSQGVSIDHLWNYTETNIKWAENILEDLDVQLQHVHIQTNGLINV